MLDFTTKVLEQAKRVASALERIATALEVQGKASLLRYAPQPVTLPPVTLPFIVGPITCSDCTHPVRNGDGVCTTCGMRW